MSCQSAVSIVKPLDGRSTTKRKRKENCCDDMNQAIPISLTTSLAIHSHHRAQSSHHSSGFQPDCKGIPQRQQYPPDGPTSYSGLTPSTSPRRHSSPSVHWPFYWGRNPVRYYSPESPAVPVRVRGSCRDGVLRLSKHCIRMFPAFPVFQRQFQQWML